MTSGNHQDVKPEPSLTEEQIKRHNKLYARANELLDGAVMLDDAPHKSPGFFAKRRLRKAVELFHQVLELNPASWQSMFFIGKAFQTLDDLEQALSWFIRANKCVPDHPSIAKEVGYAAGRLGQHDVAVRVMETVAKQHPDNAGLQTNLGLSCLLAGRIADACRAFERTVELEPQRAVNRKLLAFAKEVESGKRACPETEVDISRAIENG